MSDLPDLQYSLLQSGRKLAWRHWGEGPPLVLLHGWSMSSVVFSEVAPLLAGNYAVFCPDLPGHGYSEPCGQYSLEGIAEDIADWAQQLALPSFALLGWSLGGQVALQLALESPLLLEKLLLVATTPCFCRTDGWLHGLPKTQVKALSRNIDRCYEKTMGDFFQLQFTGEELDRRRYREIIGFAVRPGKLPEKKQAKTLLDVLSQADLRAQLQQVQLPVHILHGELDQIVPVGAGEFLADTLQEAQLQRMSGVGHAPFFSRPQQTVASWLEFLK
ncbi:carboxylesterase BioH (pimeloyl-CoA synthesis) [Malonomonas rubra DSM 5091]|uniref:Carboxylesterase BioH (Pimeloyl-CoA synthesis) n=1 Tax=Malonomonas rubra DSM 5091 TaxID=1122189 RepID=A0A1M6BAE0_MALRU|nr:carboxylesterase BioH (pimeloyl-CoA synthesis) [Malonomonas rubra DSM 5091]